MATRDDELKEKRMTFYEKDVEQINQICTVLLEKSEALAGMLIDTEGHLITQVGESKIDLESMSALIAGSYAATRQVAKLLGEEEFALTLPQGKHENIHLSLVGERALFVVVFDEKTTVGKVRLYSDQASKKLVDIFTEIAGREGDGPSLGEGFAKEADDQLDDLFGGE